MAFIKRLTVLVGAAEAARRYARKNPEQAGRFLDQAAAFVDKQTKGKYSGQIRTVADKAKGMVGIQPTGSAGYAGPGQQYGQAPADGQGAPPSSAPGGSSGQT